MVVYLFEFSVFGYKLGIINDIKKDIIGYNGVAGQQISILKNIQTNKYVYKYWIPTHCFLYLFIYLL